ncbi:apolipoprotein N-acyltransferase [Sphingomonas sp.]|uniref:apolipoprotein N-acyltransferase n=1 Tax=Sphingomonas sp. TaxID=28214 RepID=UPI00345BF88A
MSLLLGAAAALGFAPLEAWWLALPALAAWLALVHDAPDVRAALWRGWLFGWAHFTLANSWIQRAFTYQEAMPAWLGYVAPALLSLYLAIFPMMAAGLAWRWGRVHRAGAGPGLGFVLMAGAAWLLTEWLRGWALTGYPWAPLSLMWLPLIGVARAAAWTGTYALSGLTVVVAGALLLLAQGRWRMGAVVAPLLAALALNGVDIPMTPAAPDPAAPRVRIVQPNLDEEVRPTPDYPERNLRAALAQSGTAGAAPRLILWPEGALRFLIEEGYPPGYYWRGDPVTIRRRIAAALGPRDLLLTGGSAASFRADGEIASVTNSIFVLDAAGRIRGRYDKAHLVPWGEYLPWRTLLTPLGFARLVPGAIDFAPGPGPRTLPLPGFGNAGMLICYEVIFSGQIVDPRHRPAFIFNPSNDAWYGRAGPAQHLGMARLRAIEEGLPILRATPTGISAIVDAQGRVLARVAAGRTGAAEVALPAPAAPTPFARAGHWLTLLIGAALALAAVAFRRRDR